MSADESLTQHVELKGDRSDGGTVIVRILATDTVDTYDALRAALGMVSPQRLASTLMQLDPIRFARDIGAFDVEDWDDDES